MAQFGTHIEEDLQLLDTRLKQLRNEYEQYFLGSRKREPQQLRSEVNKMVQYYTNVRIQNTGQRFKFNNLRARFFTFRRHWDQIVRKIEEGRYERHLFKAKQHSADPGARPSAPVRPESEQKDLFDAYLSARQATGQDTSGITREKLERVLRQREEAIRQRYGVDRVQFRVVVENGKAKLKASAVRR